jgi:serine/threonine protein kinase
MEFVEGQSADDRLRLAGGRLSAAEVVNIAEHAARGLAAVHTAGLVHRDMKPANLIIRSDGSGVKLVDFGLALKPLDDRLTKTASFFGTPDYMAPEQICRGAAIDARTDLYALGGTMYELLTGNTPFHDLDFLTRLQKIRDEAPIPVHQINPSVPVWLSALVGKLLAKDPNKRFSTADEVAHWLLRCRVHLSDPTSDPRLPEELLALCEATAYTTPTPPETKTEPMQPAQNAPGSSTPTTTPTKDDPVGKYIGIGLAVVLGLVVLGNLQPKTTTNKGQVNNSETVKNNQTANNFGKQPDHNNGNANQQPDTTQLNNALAQTRFPQLAQSFGQPTTSWNANTRTYTWTYRSTTSTPPGLQGAALWSANHRDDESDLRLACLQRQLNFYTGSTKVHSAQLQITNCGVGYDNHYYVNISVVIPDHVIRQATTAIVQ